jgi:hypothetical protein
LLKTNKQNSRKVKGAYVWGMKIKEMRQVKGG